ncbi:flagellin [uncultured Psychromonas sp.]|uniref:flagellin N-terminal helical domain-containing protein n=1 Tax=uncultured Psychromonas sp. TaxID=173974 RepID=UPI002612F2D8|nr:flagellin [uncultured Psychromonas sp.]
MASVVNTNVMSINAQRQLGKSQATQNEAMERLSSGLRINSAKDDAAGLAISTGFQSQITGINQAVRNANDGVSMTQTAEGSMDEMSNILQRMRELSVQSANDTNSSSNRAAIQEEVDQLHSELDRIAETTEYNGTKLLDGSAGKTTLQIGANSGQTLSFEIDSVTTNALGLNGNLNKGELNSGRVGETNIGAGTLEINGTDIGAVTLDAKNSAVALTEAINLKTAETGVTASAYNVVQGDAANSSVDGVTEGLSIAVGAGAAVTLGATSSMDNLVDTINRDVEGVTASLGDEGELLLTNDNGADIVVGGTVAGSGMALDTYTGYVALDSADDTPIAVTGTTPSAAGFLESNGSSSMKIDIPTVNTSITAADKLTINGIELTSAAPGTAETTTTATGTRLAVAINALSDETGVTAKADTTTGALTLSSADGSAIEIGSNAASQSGRSDALAKLGMDVEMGGKQLDSLGTNVSTMDGAMNSIDKIDSALSQISESRAGLGAIQNRLASTISNLENVSQNLSASNSRIQDADFATETSKMSKAQILQQAGTSMLSQANASTQSVLSLLG